VILRQPGGQRNGGEISYERGAAADRRPVAELLGTTERFPRRLIAERRIRFVRVGRHVRIPESAMVEFIAAGVVEPTPRRRSWVA
jgi:excisionase family DNA binding protein